jgi:dipeptidyl aminopeptidase/acylaminoacyl peptidase
MNRFILITGIIFTFLIQLLFAQVQRREKGNLVIEDIPEIPTKIVERMQQYQNTRSANIRDWDPAKGGMLISTRFGETTQFHYVQSPGGARRQISFFAEPVGGGTICPDPQNNVFLFTKDVGGGEFYQVFQYNFLNGKSDMLTDGTSRNGSPLWSNKGDRFSYYSTKRNGRDWDVYVADINSPTKAKMVLEGNGAWVSVDWSPDDTKLLIINYISANETYYHILDIASGQLEQINPGKKNIAYFNALWARDGKGIYITSDENKEFQTLRYYDVQSKTFINLTDKIPWDVESIELNPSGDRLAFTTNENGIGQLYILDTKTRKYSKVPGIPVGQIYSLNFNPDGKKVALVINTPQTPGDIFVLDLESDRIERWTYSEVGGLNSDNFVFPELIHYNTFDQVDGKPRKIPAFYYKPAQGEGPFPVVISIHGGPEGQFVPYFSSTYQYWVNELGIAVLAPNVRGSAGYGKSYLQMDNGYKREESVKDIGKLLNWIAQQPELNSEKIAIYGGSYGGYMVLASLTHYNDRLACGIDIVGISNFVTFLENTKEYRRDLRRVEYGDERDEKMRAFLNRISPTTNAHKITKPLFVVQGLNDPRVPFTESEQMVAKIREQNTPVWYLLGKDEGHGFRKKSNRDYYTNAVVLFLENHLLNEK